jgi:hypothetical protein
MLSAEAPFFILKQLFPNIDNKYRKLFYRRQANMENDRKRRDRLYIIAEILNIAKGGSLKTD